MLDLACPISSADRPVLGRTVEHCAVFLTIEGQPKHTELLCGDCVGPGLFDTGCIAAVASALTLTDSRFIGRV